MNYKEIINQHSSEVEEIYNLFADKNSDLQNSIREEFAKRNGYVEFKTECPYLEVNGWVHNRYTIYRIIHFLDEYNLHALAEDLIIADYKKQ